MLEAIKDLSAEIRMLRRELKQSTKQNARYEEFDVREEGSCVGVSMRDCLTQVGDQLAVRACSRYDYRRGERLAPQTHSGIGPIVVTKVRCFN